MRVLQEEGTYEGRVELTIVDTEGTEAARADFDRWGIDSHGLVAFDAEGTPVTVIDGHNFGREEVVAAIESVL